MKVPLKKLFGRRISVKRSRVETGEKEPAAASPEESQQLQPHTTLPTTPLVSSRDFTVESDNDNLSVGDPESIIKRTMSSSDESKPDPLVGSGMSSEHHKEQAASVTPHPSSSSSSPRNKSSETADDAPHIVKSYSAIPVLEQTKLPRGGVSVETKAVGRVQFGIPPETIKDSMRLGIPVPQVYIVPVERFCREMGPALGVNLAEFEFPAYFNFFVYKKRCTLVVDSDDAEENIRRVFSETLLGPAQFRREEDPIGYEEEDFAPDFPRDAIPNFQKELKHFRIMPDGKELVIETLLNFNHFATCSKGHKNLGVPPPLEGEEAIGTEVPSARPMDTNSPDNNEDVEDEEVPKNLSELEKREKENPWTYSKARFMGDVATVWPFQATEEQKKNRSVPRVEIFKMPGGTEYIVHDIDENNLIVGKARLSGHVKVSESMSVDGFGGHSILDDVELEPKKTKQAETAPLTEDSESSHQIATLMPKPEQPPSFHPPSFGVTVLGNSHGFDKSGSVSGYVLWINGRGVMIDPPPYSSATLEREGIRPRTIVGIILTHCHADHDAGAFQKVLTGSPVVVITTPTIYKSFIRKYAALSALSPALLRHSHRYKPAIIGQPLRFQGATFHFCYTLHTIPCVGFRVEWRGRSMVFTGDHFNSPPAIDKLQETGVLSRARADDLRNLPLQHTDLLLHEAGAPPIHTPLDVLLKLPKRVKKRLFVVHTSALPEGCELRAAPTGTAGTIRLDQVRAGHGPSESSSLNPRLNRDNASSLSIGEDEFVWNGHTEYETINEEPLPSDETGSPVAPLPVSGSGRKAMRNNSVYSSSGSSAPPLVSLRPASSTDAWFILNLLSAVPFLSSLSYSSTMEVLETARVDAYSVDDVIVPASRRNQILCVVWEGTCSERKTGKANIQTNGSREESGEYAVWYAGDWTGPLALQPERRLSSESKTAKDHDVVAVSAVGAKVITIDVPALSAILKVGSPLYRKYLDRKAYQERAQKDLSSTDHSSTATDQLFGDALRDLNVLELLNSNSALRKLNAVQKRHLESLAEGPVIFQPGERLWRSGAPVDKAFLIVSGTASFAQRRRNAGSTSSTTQLKEEQSHEKVAGDPSNPGDLMRVDALKAIKELGSTVRSHDSINDESSMSSAENTEDKSFQFDSIFNRSGHARSSFSDSHDFDTLSKGLQKRADYFQNNEVPDDMSGFSGELSHDDVDSYDLEAEAQVDYTFTCEESNPGERSKRGSIIRRRSSRARYANKILGRLYSRRAFTGGLVFSRGHFLGDVSKMVAGLLSSQASSEVGPSYGFGEKTEGTGTEKLIGSVSDLIIIHEQEGVHVVHSSTLTAGNGGCVALVFPKSSIIPFLDEYPGLLLSLLGTQVVV